MTTGLAQPMIAGTYRQTSGFGMRGGAMHKGVDWAAPVGTGIYAAADGTVATAGSASGFGQWVVLDHIIDGKKISTVYGHMYPNGVRVRTGQIVTKGQHIADVGSNGVSTGAHLHFEIWEGGRLTGGTAVNPNTYSLGEAVAGEGFTVQNAGFDIPGTGIDNTVSAIWDFVTFVTDPHNWWRLFLFLCGTIACIYVLYTLMLRGVLK